MKISKIEEWFKDGKLLTKRYGKYTTYLIDEVRITKVQYDYMVEKYLDKSISTIHVTQVTRHIYKYHPN